MSKPQIGNGLVRISALDGRNLAKFMLPREITPKIYTGSGVCLEGTTTRVRMSRGVADSELLTDDGAEAVQGGLSYKFRTGLDVNKEVNGNP
jgi:hypothetical protein